jgi:tol-pal system protein YbgF
MYKHRILATGLLGLVLACRGAFAGNDVPVVQPSGGDIEARLARVERLVQSQGLLDLLSQVQDLQRQIKQIHGSIEEENHRIQELADKQGQLYVDINRRLLALEGGAAAHTGAAANNSAATAPGAATGTNGNPPVQVLNANDGPAPAADDGQPPALTVQNEQPAPAAPGSAAGDATANPPAGTAPAAGATAPVAAAAPPAAAGAPANTTPDSAGTGTAVAANTPPTSPGDNSAAEQAYDKAFNLLKISRYDDAIAEFNNFLVTYPNSPQADNAQFWLGEAYYVNQKYQPAIAEYQKLVSAYPNSPKVSQALLKIGFCYQDLGEADQARAALENVRQRFPGTTAARMAEDRLRQITSAPPANPQ